MKIGKEKYGNLKKDKEIKRWYTNVGRVSIITTDVYLRRLGAFCVDVYKTPQQLIKMKDKALAELISDYVNDKEGSGKAGSHIENTVKAVKSWLRFNGIMLTRKASISDKNGTPTLEEERVPTQDELKRIFNSGTGLVFLEIIKEMMD